MKRAGLIVGAIVGTTFGLTLTINSMGAEAADTTNPYFNCVSVTLAATTATAMPTTCQSGRSAVVVQNNDTASIFLGGSGVTATGATKGLKVNAGATANVEVSCDPSRTAKVFAYSTAGTATHAVTVCETR